MSLTSTCGFESEVEWEVVEFGGEGDSGACVEISKRVTVCRLEKYQKLIAKKLGLSALSGDSRGGRKNRVAWSRWAYIKF